MGFTVTARMGEWRILQTSEKPETLSLTHSHTNTATRIDRHREGNLISPLEFSLALSLNRSPSVLPLPFNGHDDVHQKPFPVMQEGDCIIILTHLTSQIMHELLRTVSQSGMHPERLMTCMDSLPDINYPKHQITWKHHIPFHSSNREGKADIILSCIA